jgi:hypothetical protein
MAPETHPVQDYHVELMEAARHLRLNLARVAYYGFRMRLCDGWTAMGYESGPRGEEAYRERLGIPRSTYYKYVRIGQALHQLPLADLERIPVTNAELLIQVNPAILQDYSWVDEAKTLAPAALAELVTTRNKTAGDEREPMASVMFRVPFLAKKAIEGMVDAFRHRNELSSRGQALELMIADRQYDTNLLTVIDQASRLLNGALKSMQRRKAPEDEERGWIQMAKELLDESYAKAVQAARQKKDGRVQETGGRP